MFRTVSTRYITSCQTAFALRVPVTLRCWCARTTCADDTVMGRKSGPVRLKIFHSTDHQWGVIARRLASSCTRRAFFFSFGMARGNEGRM